MVFERPHDDADPCQALLDSTVSFDGTWFIIAIPKDHIHIPFTCSFNHFFLRFAATPLKRNAPPG
jgi:hypothetical protein